MQQVFSLLFIFVIFVYFRNKFMDSFEVYNRRGVGRMFMKIMNRFQGISSQAKEIKQNPIHLCGFSNFLIAKEEFVSHTLLRRM